MINPRMRMAALAGSLALSLSLVAAPVVVAQDSPEDAIQAFADAFEAKDFENLASYFCEEQAGQVGDFDVSEMADLPPGVDPTTLFDAFIFDIEITSMELISETETEAVVDLTGSMSMDIDVDALTPFIVSFMESLEMPTDEASVEEMKGLMVAQMGDITETTDISAEITLVPGVERPWLICSDLGIGSDSGSGSEEEAVTEPVTE